MPTPTKSAFDRISRSVQYTESMLRNWPDPPPAPIAAARDLAWVSLNNDAFGSVVTGQLCTYSTASGRYTVSSNTVTVWETTGLIFGQKNQQVLCRPTFVETSPYAIYEIVWAPNSLYCNTTSAVSGATFTVNTPGGSAMTVNNWCGWSTSASSGVTCLVECDGAGGFRFLQGPCGM